MIKCPNCNRFSGDAAKVCFNCGYVFEKNHVNSSISENKSNARNNNIKKEKSFNNKKYENSYSKNDTTQSFYYKNHQNEEENIKAQKREKVKEAIERIKKERKNKEEKEKGKVFFENQKANTETLRTRSKSSIITGYIILVVVLEIVGMFFFKNVFVSEKSFYGTWEAVSCVDLDSNGGEFINSVKEYIFVFYENGTGYFRYETNSSSEEDEFLWKMSGNEIFIYSLDDEEYTQPKNVWIKLKGKKLSINWGNDYLAILERISK